VFPRRFALTGESIERKENFWRRGIMKFKDDCVEESYGIIKTSYRALLDPDGFLIVKVYHDNKQTRSFIRFHSQSPKDLLSHFDRLSKSPIKAESYLSEIMSKHWNHFENNKVKFIEL